MSDLGFEHDEFGIVVPMDIGERAAQMGYTGGEAFRLLKEQMEREAANGDREPDSWQPVNLAELGDQPPVQPTLGQVGIVYPGKRHVFSGPQESAKTLAAYAIALEVVRHGGTVVIIDFEMGRWDARDRLVDLGATPQELASIHYVDPSEPATTDRIARLVALKPQLVIVDAAAGAYDIQGLDDNKRQDVERFTRVYVRDFWRADIATIVLDHVVKNADLRGNYAIGSERKVGGVDVHLGFEVINPIKRGTVGLYRLVTHKDRGGHLQRGSLAMLTLTSDPGTHQIRWEFKPVEHHLDDDEPWRPTILMQRISEYLEPLDEPVSRNTIVTNVKGREEHKRVAIDHLVAMGYAAETPGERGAKLVQSVQKYRENDPPIRPNPTSSHLIPDDVTSTSAYIPVGDMREEVDGGQDQATSSHDQIDVYDPTIQHLLDDIPDY